MRVLNVMSSLDCGGVEMMLTNYYNKFPDNDIIFDFIVHEEKEGLLECDLLKKGSLIYHVTPKKKNFFKNILEVWKIIDKTKYKIVYCHQNYMSFFTLMIAKMKGIKIRIVHAHGYKAKENFLCNIKNFIFRFFIKKCATNFFACGLYAGKWLYGKNWNEKFPTNVIIKNAIDVNKFIFNTTDRLELRNKYSIGNKKCLLQVGRLSSEKNQIFSLQLCSKLDMDKYCLFLIGEGKDLTILNDYVKNHNVKNVFFLNNKNDIYRYYSMADLLLFPSLNEGFGIVAIEAQTNGLPVVASTNVPNETNLGFINYIPLDDIDSWIKSIGINKRVVVQNSFFDLLSRNGYDIEKESLKLYNLLKSLIERVE